ncbi:MAG: sugar ABC transporter permease [Acutalibacter sp.]|nr:sugar ABC transporter permease [Acutalibacter sp.]
MRKVRTERQSFKKMWQKNKYLLLIFLPVFLYYLIFAYTPMFGLVIAFKDYQPFIGVFDSKWVGFKHFLTFFNSEFFTRVLGNTLGINLLNLALSFPAPIILALLLDEVRHPRFKKSVQTITYMPHFISIVVVVGMLQDIMAVDYGIVNRAIMAFGGEQIRFMTEPGWFKILYVLSGIWQNVGWSSIIYIAAINGIDQALYEAAAIDGANRWQKIWHVTLPGIADTIIVLLILQIGNMLNVGFEKVLLMYNSSNMATADVISTYVYRVGLLSGNLSYGAAVGLFNSVINCFFLFMANGLSKRFSGRGLF